MAHEHDARIARRESTTDGERAVGGTVLDDDDLQRLRLLERRSHRRLDVTGGVVHGSDDADAGRRATLHRSGLCRMTTIDVNGSAPRAL